MSILSDNDIRHYIYSKSIIIEPYDDNLLQPASYDVRLHHILAIPLIPTPDSHSNRIMSITYPPEVNLINIKPKPYILAPGEFILGALEESITINNMFVARIEGKSSLGRLGLAIHITAGFVDPGWNGRLTIEIKNHAPYPVELSYLMKIGQVSFQLLLNPSFKKYGDKGLGSKYNNATQVEGVKTI